MLEPQTIYFVLGCGFVILGVMIIGVGVWMGIHPIDPPYRRPMINSRRETEDSTKRK